MKYGINTYIWTAEFGPAHFHLLPEIKAHGFDGIEVALFRPAEFAAAAIRRAAEAEGLERTVASALIRGLSLISDDADVRRRTVEHLRDSIRAVADAGARLIIGPLYCPVGELPGRRRTADEWQRAIEGYQSITDTLVENDVTLATRAAQPFRNLFPEHRRGRRGALRRGQPSVDRPAVRHLPREYRGEEHGGRPASRRRRISSTCTRARTIAASLAAATSIGRRCFRPSAT